MNPLGVWGLALAPIGLIVGAGAASAQTLNYEGGVAMARGAYVFEDATTSWTLSTGAALFTGRFFARVGLPVYLQNTTLVAGSGAGPIPTGGSSSGSVADSGRARKGRDGARQLAELRTAAADGGPVEVPASAYEGFSLSAGDPVGQIGWRLAGDGRSLASASVSVKAPVTDTATVGTGEWDAGVTVMLARGLGTWGGVSLEASYWRLGDMPTLELRDPVQGSLGIFGFLGQGWAGSATLIASTAVLAGYDPPVSIGAALTRVASRRAVSVSAAVGLTETAPTLSAGVSWSLRLAGY